MKNVLLYGTILFLFTLFISCGNADDDISFDINQRELGLGEEPDNCLGFEDNELLLSIQDEFTTLPSKVSILFRVSDRSGNPISGLTANQFTIYEQGRNDDCFNTISTSESLARISPNTQVFSNTTLLVLDLSNSVLEGSLDELKEAASSFVDNVLPETESESFAMAIYWFDGEDELHLLQEPSPSAETLKSAIDGIATDISNDPSTDLYGAVIKSANIAEDLIRTNNNASRIGAASVVLFTDGTDQASRFTEESALNAVNSANTNISFFTIGLGSEIDTGILSAIGTTASVFASNKEELETTFNEISQRVAELANSYYLFEYCTPKRDGSGNNNLVIQLSNNGLSGAVQTRFDATGFIGGCE